MQVLIIVMAFPAFIGDVECSWLLCWLARMMKGVLWAAEIPWLQCCAWSRCLIRALRRLQRVVAGGDSCARCIAHAKGVFPALALHMSVVAMHMIAHAQFLAGASAMDLHLQQGPVGPPSWVEIPM